MTEQAVRYGVWFSNGEYACGWLQEEGGNGRCYTWKGTSEEAKAKAADEESHSTGFAFAAMRFGGGEEEARETAKQTRERARAKQRARWA
jgi:hypothetical protein